MVALLFKAVNLRRLHTKNNDVIITNGAVNFNICAILGAKGNGAVHHKLHITCAAGFGTC